MEQRKVSFKLDFVLILLLTLLSTAERIQVSGLPLYSLLFIPLLFRVILGTVIHRNGHILCDRFELTILAWLFVGTLLTLFYGVEDNYRGLQSLYLNSLIIFTIYTYRKEHFDYNFLIGLLCGLILNLVIGLMEIHRNGFHVVSNFTEYYLRIFQNKAVGFQVNANDYCAMLLVYIIGLLYLNKKLAMQNRILKILVFGCIFVSIYILFRDFSRAAIICLLIIGAYLLIYRIFGKHRWQAISLVLLVFGGMILLITNGLEEKLSAFIDVNSDMARLRIYRDTWTFIKQHLFLGVGAGNTTRLMGASPHNLFFEILSDYGVFIAVPVTLLITKLLRYKSDRDDGHGYYLIMLFGICFILSGFSVSSLLRNRICWVFFAYFSRQLKEVTYTENLQQENLETTKLVSKIYEE